MKPMHHDLRTLRLFAAICHSGSVSKAAAQLNMAVSAASRRLRLLEEEVGAALVMRQAHGVEPTMAGLTTLRYAETVMRLSDGLSASMREFQDGVRGRVRVSASSSALVHTLASDLALFSQNHPEIRIDLEELPSSETITLLGRGQTDVGVFIRGVNTSGLITYPYSQDRLMLAVRKDHPLSGHRSVKLVHLLDEDFVALEVASAIYRLVTEKVRDLGHLLKIRVQVRSYEVMCQMIQSGLGVGILPGDALRPLASALDLVLVELDEVWSKRYIDIGVPAGVEQSQPIQKLLNALIINTNHVEKNGN
jgi:DNA-binding transcriptional LysR family regulator